MFAIICMPKLNALFLCGSALECTSIYFQISRLTQLVETIEDIDKEYLYACEI